MAYDPSLAASWEGYRDKVLIPVYGELPETALETLRNTFLSGAYALSLRIDTPFLEAAVEELLNFQKEMTAKASKARIQ